MQHALFRVKRHNNRKLSDDQFVEKVMDKLMVDFPQVYGYSYERPDEDNINILMWGDIEVVNGG